MSLEREVLGIHTDLKYEEFIGKGRNEREAFADATSQIRTKYDGTGYEALSIHPRVAIRNNATLCIFYGAVLIKETEIRKEPVQIFTMLPGMHQ